MCIKTQTSRFTGSSWAQLERLAAALQKADAVLVGAGAGLSTSAGFAYSGERFRRYFGDFEAAYGFHDMYSGGFYPFPTLEEHWAYWSRFIFLNRYCDPPKPVYQNLLELVQEKDTFVLTTNVDHCFQKAGFDKRRLFYTQGDYGLWQCSRPCHDKTYDNQEAVRQMVEAQGFQVTERGLLPPAQLKRAVPTELVPRCPVCGAPMSMKPAGGQHLCPGRRLAPGRPAVRMFFAQPQGAAGGLPGVGGGVQHPGDYQVPLLADDRGQSPGHLCVRQLPGRPVPPGD